LKKGKGVFIYDKSSLLPPAEETKKNESVGAYFLAV